MSKGIEGFFVETHSWKETVTFWKALGYELVFQTSHHTGELRHPSGGPYVLVAERPAHQALQMYPVIVTEQATRFTPPTTGTVARAFRKVHWGVLEMLLQDPDGRVLSVQARSTHKAAPKAARKAAKRRKKVA
ncbi:MAG: hypothetical protein U0229_02660 [Anaeromyxobacter sp.]